MSLKFQGEVWVRKNGILVAQGKNLVVTSGLNLISKLIGGVGIVPSHMAIGNSGGASLASMTALQGTELERVALTSTAVASNTISYSATFGSSITITVTVREIAILNASSGGEMLCRFICSGFDISAGEQAEVDWLMTVQPT